MKRKLLFFISVVVGVMIIVAPLSPAVAGDEVKAKVMTRNLYLGADIFKVVEAAQEDPDSIPDVVAEVFQTMLETNFSARAEAIADEIADAKPQVIGLQEVSTFYKQTPGDFLVYNPIQGKFVPNPEQTPADEDDIVIDFYTVLDTALKARGMYYDAYPVTNADVELPMLTGFVEIPGLPDPVPTFDDVRMVDHDYVLVRKGHAAAEVLTGNYQAKLEIDLGGIPVAFDRGYVIVDVNIKDEDFRFVSTHLEVRNDIGSVFRFVQSAQMQELLLTLDGLSSFYPKPVILVGDFNSSIEDETGESWVPNPFFDPELPPSEENPPVILVGYVPPYLLATEPGYMQAIYPDEYSGRDYLDSWLEQAKPDEGNTSGFDEYVSDPDAELTTRIDHIFLDPEYLTVDKVSSDVVGDEVSDMIPNTYPNPIYAGDYLWPSDHAGVVGKIKFLE